MNLTKAFTQGGQVTLHNLRMIRQVLGVTLGTTLIIGSLFFGIKAWMGSTTYQKQVVIAYAMAKAKLSIPIGNPLKWMQDFPMQNGKIKTVRAVDVVRNHGVLYQVHIIEQTLWNSFVQTLIVMVGTLIFFVGFWIWRGKSRKAKEILFGSDIVPIKRLIQRIRKDKKASDLILSGLPMIKDSETKHLLIVGTTGAGKTNTFNHLLPQVRAKNQKAIIVDTTGTFVENFFNPATDILLNPLDERSANWSLWDECKTSVRIDDFASSMIPHTLHDQFWCDAGRLLLSQTIKILQKQGNPSVQALLDYAIHKPLTKIQKFYAHTPAASLVDIAADKTAASIRITLSTHLKSLHLIEDQKDGFSIQEWIKDDSKKGWLFLAAMPDQRETLRPLMSSWLNIAINSLMSCRPDHDRRVWFFIDEKQSLNKIETLPKALAEIRKYGGCVVAGLQNISQIDTLYGHEARKTMSSLYNTKIFFRSPDTDTAQWISKMIGEHEVLENNEGISYGAHQMRDGVSLNEHKKQKPIIPYSEFLNLKDLEAYIKLPEDYPVSKITFDYKHIESKNLPFIEKPEREFEANSGEGDGASRDLNGHKIEETDNVQSKFNLLKIG